MSPKPQDDRPTSQQIAADLREQVMSGTLRPDEQLPSTAELVAQYDSSNATIQAALRMLKLEGFMYGQQGRGVFVRNKQPLLVDVSPYFEPTPGRYSYELLEIAHVNPGGEIADVLGLGENDTAVLRKRLMRHDGDPVELNWSYYPSDIAAGTPLAEARKIRGGAPRVLAEAGFPQEDMVDTISVRMPTTEEIETLDLPDVPVLRQFRIIYSRARRPVEVSILIKGGHLYQLRYRQPLI